MTSASLNSRNLVMSLPMQAVSISHRCRFEKCSRQKMHHRSHRKRQRSNGDQGRPTTVMSCVSLSLTSILAFTPLLFRAFTNRLAATAAPPIRSLVFTISTRILLNVLFLSRADKRMQRCFLQRSPLPSAKLLGNPNDLPISAYYFAKIVFNFLFPYSLSRYIRSSFLLAESFWPLVYSTNY